MYGQDIPKPRKSFDEIDQELRAPSVKPLAAPKPVKSFEDIDREVNATPAPTPFTGGRKVDPSELAEYPTPVSVPSLANNKNAKQSTVGYYDTPSVADPNSPVGRPSIWSGTDTDASGKETGAGMTYFKNPGVAPRPRQVDPRSRQAAQVARKINEQRNEATRLFKQADATPMERMGGAFDNQQQLRAQAEGKLEQANILAKNARQDFGDVLEVGFGKDADPNSKRQWAYAKPKSPKAMEENDALAIRARDVERPADPRIQRRLLDQRTTMQKAASPGPKFQQFTPPEEVPGWVGDKVSRFGRAAVGTIPGAISGTAKLADAMYGGLQRMTGNRLPEAADWSPVVSPAMESAQKGIEDTLPVDPSRNEDFSSKIASGLGSAAGFGKIGGAARAIGLPFKSAIGAAGVGLGADEIAREMKEAGFRRELDPARYDRAVMMGGATGLTELVGLGKTLERFGLKRAVMQRGVEVLENSGQEAFQQWMGNVNAANVGAYDLDREQGKGVLEAAILGGIVSGGVQAADLGMQAAQPASIPEQLANRTLTNQNAAIRAERAPMPGIVPTAAPGPTNIIPLQRPAAQTAVTESATPIPAIDPTVPKSTIEPTEPATIAAESPSALPLLPAPADFNARRAKLLGLDAPPEVAINEQIQTAEKLLSSPNEGDQRQGMRMMNKALSAIRKSDNYLQEASQAEGDKPYTAVRAAIEQRLQPAPKAELPTPVALPDVASAPTAELPVAQPGGTGLRLIEQTRAKVDQAINEGRFDEAVAELRAHQQALRDAKTAARKSPGLRTQLERQIGQTGNRIGEVRRMAADARKRANAPTKTATFPQAKTPQVQNTQPIRGDKNADISAPLLRPEAVQNPEGGIPEMPEQTFSGRLQQGINRQEAQRPAAPAKRLISRVAELGGISNRYAGELQGVKDARRVGVVRGKPTMSPDILARQLQSEGYDIDPENLDTLWEAIRRDGVDKNERPANTNDLNQRLKEKEEAHYVQQESQSSKSFDEIAAEVDAGRRRPPAPARLRQVGNRPMSVDVAGMRTPVAMSAEFPRARREMVRAGREVEARLKTGQKKGQFGKVAEAMYKSIAPGVLHGQDSFFNDPDLKGKLGLTRDVSVDEVKKELNSQLARSLGVTVDEVSLSHIKPDVWRAWARQKGLGKTAMRKLEAGIARAEGKENAIKTNAKITAEESQRGKESVRKSEGKASEPAPIKTGDSVTWQVSGKAVSGKVTKVNGQYVTAETADGETITRDKSKFTAAGENAPSLPSVSKSDRAPEANYWKTPRVENAPVTDEDGQRVVADSRIEFRQAKRGAGTLWTNHQAAIVIASAANQTGADLGAASGFAGLSMSHQTVTMTADLLREKADDYGTNGKRLIEIADALEAAQQDAIANNRDDVVIADSTSADNLSEAKRLLREERFHSWQRSAGLFDKNVSRALDATLGRNPIYRRIKEVLLEEGYNDNPRILTTEAAAKAASGQWERYGLKSEDEALDFLNEYYKASARMLGVDALMENAPATPQARKVQENARNEEKAKLGGGVQSAQATRNRGSEGSVNSPSLGRRNESGRTGRGEEANASSVSKDKRASFGSLANEPTGQVLASGLNIQSLFKSKPKAASANRSVPLPKDFKLDDWAQKTLSGALVNSLSKADKAKYDEAKTPREKNAILLSAPLDAIIEDRAYKLIDKAIEAVDKKDTRAVMEAVRDAKEYSQSPATNYEKASALRKAFMLSSPVTHARNIIGNTLFQPLEEAARIPGSIADATLGLITGRRSYIGANPAEMMRAGYEAATTGWQRGKDAMRGLTLDDLETTLQTKEIKFKNKAVDASVKFIFRSLNAQDQVFFTYAYDRVLREHAKLTARNEARAGIIDRKKVSERAKELHKNPTPQMEIDAKTAAEVAVFRNSNKLSDALQSARQSVGDKGSFAVDLFVPFDKTPTNLIARILEYTPVGAMRAAGKLAAAGGRTMKGFRAARKEGMPNKAAIKDAIDKAMTPAQQREFSQLVGRSVAGTAPIALGYVLAAAGMASGYYDDEDKTGEAKKRETGSRPASIKIGDRWYQVGGIPPLGSLITMGATLYQEVSKAESTFEGVAKGAYKGIGGAITNLPLLSGAKEIIEGFTKPGTAGQKVGRIGASFIPGILSDAGQSIPGVRDEYEREARADKKYKGAEKFGRDVAGAMAARVPILRKSLPEKKTALGEKIPTEWHDVIDPFSSRPAVDVGARGDFKGERFEQGKLTGEVKQKAGEPDAIFNKRKERVEKWMDEYGDKLINHPRYKALSEDQQKAAVESLRRRIGAQQNRVSPKTTGFEPNAVLLGVKRSAAGKAKRQGKYLYSQP